MSDFDFIDHYGDNEEVKGEEQLADNEVVSSLNCAVVGIGGGGGKMAKAFLDIGFNKTLLVNTTAKDIPEEIDDKHVVLIPDADGIGKDVNLGKNVFADNGAVVEDALRTKLGSVDWLFVFAGGGGGTGSAAVSLHGVFERYLKSVSAEGNVVYIVSQPSAQEALNSTISKNAASLLEDVSGHTHIVLDNERQVKLLRGKVGMLGMFPFANTAFAKLLAQVLKLSSEQSSIQSFDSKDLERCLRTKKRTFIGSTIIRDPKDPEISKHLDAAISYVGGRTETLFAGVYVKENLPGLVAILTMNGLD